MTDPPRGLAARLPVFPWDLLAPAGEVARRHPDGVVDLSIGTPVDDVPDVVQQALTGASNSPGYPPVVGTPQLREAAAAWFARTLEVDVAPSAILPTIGSKELISWLPTLLGLGSGDTVVIPELAYPTYDVGARVAGCQVLAADSTAAVGPARVALVWLNSPSNPTGKVLPAAHQAKVVAWARERGAVVVADECYVELGWTEQPVSVLHPSVCGGSHEGLLSVQSLSKRSNLAGYRAGIVAGDPALIETILAARKHVGLMVPGPVQAAAAAAFADDAHVAVQKSRYATRRTALLAALTASGFTIEHSEAGLYLWATRGESCWDTVDWLAHRGILVAPGEIYGPTGGRHVRFALTATDERIAAAVARLSTIGDPEVGSSVQT